jgi:hypothetical protein
VHVLGKFKVGEKPNREEIESIVKAGGAQLVDAAEAAAADLVIMHPSMPHDHPKACPAPPADAVHANMTMVNIMNIAQEPQR